MMEKTTQKSIKEKMNGNITKFSARSITIVNKDTSKTMGVICDISYFKTIPLRDQFDAVTFWKEKGLDIREIWNFLPFEVHSLFRHKNSWYWVCEPVHEKRQGLNEFLAKLQTAEITPIKVKTHWKGGTKND